MALFSPEERRFAEGIAALAFANPFLDERIAIERRLLGDAYVASQPYWSLLPDPDRKANIDAIAARCGVLVAALQSRLRGGRSASASELELHDEVVVYFLYERYRDGILKLIERGEPGPAGGRGRRQAESPRVELFDRFRADAAELLGGRHAPGHLFALFHQVRRAFHHVFSSIVGRTLPAARLRAAIWESIFTHDVRRYRRSGWAHLGDVATLVTGPTGTGKELVARAIGLSRYVPFDESAMRFAGDPMPPWVGLNLAALSPTLIESELFGHRKGSFTGAIADRDGFLESCGELGAVFLDEIGEVEPAIQVKLLRVIQTRTFQRLGESKDRRFAGKLIAATNRDLAAEMARGRFREDLYYRLCGDTVATPTLHEQLAADPRELEHLVRFISARVAGEEEALGLARDVVRAIAVSPGLDYRWPGNFRELEQCVRSVLLRGGYHPTATVAGDARRRLADGILAGSFDADELLRRYCTLLYADLGSYSAVAQRLGLDRRTVRAKVDPVLLAEL